MTPPAPALLPPNDIPRFYRGGREIARLRGAEPVGERFPEDWVGSTTEAFGEPGVGLSRLPDGTLLRDAVAADPEGWLGAAHVTRWGADPALLVKLLDSGDRLPVHVHPDGPWAREHLGTRFGKTEAWIVIAGRGSVSLGWRDAVADDALQGWIDDQDADAMEAALHQVPVGPGDAVLVPAGVAHSIGQGLLIVELQEPSDMSVMLEWRGHGIDGVDDATLRLGWPLALTCTERAARDPRALRGPVRGSAPTVVPERVLPPTADPFFRAEWLRPDGGATTLDEGFSVVTVLEGSGTLEAAAAGDGTADALPPTSLSVARGDNVVIPFAVGSTVLRGDVRALRCRPADPSTPEVPAR